MANKRKTTTAIVAGVTAAALLLGGTFAWTSISQQATNETAGIVNVGGRLHDDFDGTNKDVYVENFTDPLNGGQPIYARVKLTEYMEVGQDAGSGAGVDGDNDGKIEAVPVIAGTTIDNDKDWKVFIPGTITGTEITCGDCNEENGLCGIHDHWKWTVSGGKTYMPTFNKDKDSLAADINGTYHGTVDTDKVYYDDYVEYTTTEQDGVNNNIAEADKEAYEGEIYSVIGTEYYDDDTDTDDNGGTRQVADVTHIAKETATATVITMEAWLANPVPGNYWVYDTDGWAYWANPIMPGEATGLLLDGIEMYQNPGEKCYYAINVVGQFATVNDWEYFTDGGAPSTNAQNLLQTAAKNVATVVVTNASGETLLTPGSTYDFSANVYVDNVAKYAATDFEWSVLNADLTAAKSTIEAGADDIATLTVAENETAKNLIVVAKSKDANYLGALGMTSVAVDVKAEPVYSISVLPQTVDDGEGGTYESPYQGSMADGESWTMQLDLDGVPVTENVTWSMELVYSDSTSDTVLEEGTAIGAETGVLTVADGETSDSYTFHIVKVTASIDGTEMASKNLAISGEGMTTSGLVFYEAGTTNRVSPAYLTKGGTYDVRIGWWHQSGYNDTATDYLEPISLENATVTVTGSDGNSTGSATFVDGQFTATETGKYTVSIEYTNNFEYADTETGYVTVQEGLSILFDDTLYASGSTATYGVMNDGTLSEGFEASESDNVTWEVVSVTGNVSAFFSTNAPNWLFASGCTNGDEIVIKASKPNGIYGTLTIVITQ